MTTFTPEVVDAVLGHMNRDHTEDSLVIVRAFAEPAAESALMTGLDAAGATWDATVDGAARRVTVAWPGPVVDRGDIRREVVNLFDQASAQLGLPPREGH